MNSGADLIREIDQTLTAAPTLWWLEHSGFIIRIANITFYVDPCSSDVKHADMILATHAHPGHLDAASLVAMLEGSPRAKVVVPRGAHEYANAAGIPYDRMTTTDNGLRIEYFKDNLYGRIYAVPSAPPELEWISAGGYPYLGYLIRFGRWTIYHAGDCVGHADRAGPLRPFNVSVALMPMHYGAFLDAEHRDDRENDFEMHMLGQRPAQRFQTFQVGEKWTVPEE